MTRSTRSMSMVPVALGALRARRAQTAVLLLIAALVTAAAVAAPFFVLAASESLAAHDVSLAPAGQRLVTASRALSVSDGSAPFDQYRSDIRRDLRLPGFDQVTGATADGVVTGPAGSAASPLAARDDVCAQVVLRGGCPTGTDDALVSTQTAADLGVGVGDRVRFTTPARDTPLVLRVSGLYQPRDPAAPYWGAGGLLATATRPAASAAADRPRGTPDAVFVTWDGLRASRVADARYAVDHIATPAGLNALTAADIGRAVDDGAARLKADGYQLDTDLPRLVDRVLTDQRTIQLGVPLGAGQLVLFGWYALFLAVTAEATARRADIGLLKLRGLPRRRIWSLAGLQSALPVLAGLLPGVLLGYLLARALAGGVADPGQRRLAVALAAGAAAVAVLGGLLAALMAERRTVRADVAELLRRTPRRPKPGRRRILRAEMVDLALAALALAAVYQVHSAGQGSGLVVLAPGLVAFAAGLLAARLLPPVAARVARAGLRGGRLRAALTGTYLARRPGLGRLFALVAIASTLAGYAALAWGTSAAARHQRAVLEVGADRVLTVAPVATGRLLSAVRQADPSGRYAMAAVQTATSAVPAVLAVDSTRLAAVAAWSPGYGSVPDRLATLLHPPAPAPVPVVADRLRFTVTVNALGPGSTYLTAILSGPDGRRVLAGYGPLAVGRHDYETAGTPCATPPGCRLDGFALTGAAAVAGRPLDAPAPGLDLVLHSLSGAGLADRDRWRPSTDPVSVGPVLHSDPSGLHVTLPAGDSFTDGVRRDGQILLVDAPTPVPVVLAGQLRDAGLVGEPAVGLFASTAVPVRVAAQVPVLPRLGRAGALVDLDYADRLVDDGNGPRVSQVWLAAGTPAAVVDRLRAAGLRVLEDETVGGRAARYAGSGPVAALRFQLLGAVLAVILAGAGVVLVAAVERDPRAEELTALRHQGLPARAARASAFDGYAWLTGAALLAGLLVAPVDRLVTGAVLPLFSDDWRVLPPPPLLGPGALLVAVGCAVVLIGAAAGFAGYQLARRVSR
ncbi:ABC transporter permease [Planosporangium thailandense]|uniref:ABC transporter permease n=1 Tax=Planosporangium thailandense TaxID=765197 RepID=A0ABX0Y143_9ACTN|nr:ABC transporter permease [Planosporangium thailandense]NJC72066.1 ABC transporter permease [Planosporangium thailandense]